MNFHNKSHSFHPNFKLPILKISPVNLVQHLIITWSLLSSVTSYDIWSIYFDDTIPDLYSVNQQTRQQLFNVPFTSVRHIFEITTYINDTNWNNIRRLELTICDESTPNNGQPPHGSSFQDPINLNVTFFCLQKIATEKFPTTPNQTVLKYPPDVGFPINADSGGSRHKFMLTIEYDQDYRLLNDNSGFDLYISDEPLSIEAGIMAIGSVPDVRFLLPPNVTEWNTKGTCHTSCFYYKMNTDQLQIVAMFPSTNHRYLDELVVEIDSSTANRSAMVQKIFSWGGDSSVDMSELPIFRVEDKINVRCSYSTGTNSTLGGLADENENCLIWMHYYPKVELAACMSSYSSATIMSLLDADEVSTTLTPDAGLNFMINGQPLDKFIADKDQHQRWNYRKLTRSRYSAENGRQRPQCSWTNHSHSQLRRRRRRRRRRR